MNFKKIDKRLLEPIDGLDCLIIWKQDEVKKQIKRFINRDFDTHISCCRCQKIIEYQQVHKSKVIKSWGSVCLNCLKDLEKDKSPQKGDK